MFIVRILQMVLNHLNVKWGWYMAILSQEQLVALKQKVRKVTETDLEEIQLTVERTNVFPDEYYDVCRKNDLFRLAIPEEFGGLGLNCEQFFLLWKNFAEVLAACV
ncbi:acyl-CoA dehydrogenase family protein [Escherichia albertii]|uniref:acyl-CoA dehydrogenase family protein n=2 Tax=Escherichia albertii TaxID=208962 RepID=UPI00201D9CB0|nr:acyl-CoA dehydrogenase family protein [Escherichia albertii]MCZ8761785.1 acyl-CoA dehydrogenase family protein [Escherichia albertii]